MTFSIKVVSLQQAIENVTATTIRCFTVSLNEFCNVLNIAFVNFFMQLKFSVPPQKNHVFYILHGREKLTLLHLFTNLFCKEMFVTLQNKCKVS